MAKPIQCVVSPDGDRGVELGEARGTRLVAHKAFEALVGEAFPAAPDTGLGLAGVAHDRAPTDAFGRQPHDLCAPDGLLRRELAAEPYRHEPYRQM
jgi:hypothetical protein